MPGTTGWSAGRLYSGFGWNALFGPEINSLAAGSSVLSSVAIANSAAFFDQQADWSMVMAVSTTIAAGNGVTLWLLPLEADGTTIGDGRLTTTASAYIVPFPAWATFYPATGAITTFAGGQMGLPFLPGTYYAAIQNNLAVAFPASGITCAIRTYNQADNI